MKIEWQESIFIPEDDTCEIDTVVLSDQSPQASSFLELNNTAAADILSK